MRIIFLILFSCFIGCSTPISEKEQLAEEVKSEFLHAWQGYKKYAWGHDALRPLSKTSRDWYGVSLYMTPVDAYDTMLLMGLNEEAEETKSLILENLHFDHDISVSVFEITIRLLGGLLSAYEMDGDERFLALANDLGNRLLPAFKTPTGMPYGKVNLKTASTNYNINNPAEIGTLLLEFGTLTKHTGNPIYYQTAKKAFISLFERRSEIGLVGTTINVDTGEWINTQAHISGRIDSYYEYALKAWLLFKDEDFIEIWDIHHAAINTYLLDQLESGFWYGRSDMHTGERTETTYGALDAFMPGLLVLAGDLETAQKVQESNFKMWELYGVEPEILNYTTMKLKYANYPLRPENIESAFYLYRATKDPKYIEMGKTMFRSLVNYSRTDEAYAALDNVITKEKSDDMESFFLAETLKYAYLLFANENTLSLETHVFNTEAHPFRIN